MVIKILVAAHKDYWMPPDECYLPIHVGAKGRPGLPGFIGDDSGDEISEKNASYCELTGQYWAWKNLRADYVGLVHYRRHFSNGRHFGDKKSRVLREDDFRRLLRERDILLPRPRNYWIETNYQQYAHAHHAADLDTVREVLMERCLNYVEAFDASMKRTRGHRFNMFVMKRELFDAYCAWLFDVLFAVEQRLDISGYSSYDRRVFGFLSERLMDVWLETNGCSYQELPYVFMENQNWLVKGGSFLLRKFGIQSQRR